MAFKDRVKELRRVPASEIKPHPQNPRLHSDDQRRTLRYMLKKVGVADVSVVYEDPECQRISEPVFSSRLPKK